MNLKISIKTLSEVVNGKILKGDPSAEFNSFVTDTRKIEQGSFFWPLKGINHDAHDFLPGTLSKVSGWMVRDNYQTDKYPQIVIAVDDTLKAMQRLAAWHRRRFNIPIASVTGSNGKSSTKEMLRSILSLKGKTCSNAGNLNNQFGVPASVLELSEDDKYGVFELGASHMGDIDEIARIALPDLGIITNIAPSHLEFFGSLENIFKTKTELLKYIKPNGALVYNNDDAHLKVLSNQKNFHLVSFGYSPDSDVQIKDGGLIFKKTGQTIKIKLPYPGEHNYLNAAAAAGAALSFNIDAETIKYGLEHYSAPKMRMQEIKINNNTVILDAYNANPQSMSSAFKELSVRKGKKYLILGDMKELGGFSKHYHEQIGKQLLELNADGIFMAGAEMKYAADIYVNNGGKNLIYDLNAETWKEKARELLKSVNNSIFLVKASRSMAFEKILDLEKGK